MRRGFLFSAAIVLLVSSFGLADVGRHRGFAVGSVKDEAQASGQVSFTVGMNAVAPKQCQGAQVPGQAGTGLAPSAFIAQVVQHQVIEQALSMCPPVQWQMPHQCRAFGLHLGPRVCEDRPLGPAAGVQAFVYVYDEVLGGAYHASTPSQSVRAVHHAAASGGACCDSDKGSSSGGGCAQVGVPH